MSTSPGKAVSLRAVLNREGAIMLFALFCLLLLMKFGRSHAYRLYFSEYFADGDLPTLQPYLYSAVSSVVTRMLLPLAFIVFVLRERPRDFGYRLGGGRTFLSIYAALLLVMVPVLWFVAGSATFQAKYPFWDRADESWRFLLLYEFRYFFIFLSGEAFWRGFLVFGLARRYGWHALSIAMIPYVLVHFGKPFPETLAAILTGYLLGYLALKHRSFVLGIALHYSVALLMDLFALIRSGSLPTVW